MNDKKTIEYENVLHVRPDELMEFSYEQLDDLIIEAETIIQEAELVSKWLSAIKIEKVRLKHLKSKNDGGAE